MRETDRARRGGLFHRERLSGDGEIGLMRAVRLEQQDYRIRTQSIPATVTLKNRLLIGAPAAVQV